MNKQERRVTKGMKQIKKKSSKPATSARNAKRGSLIVIGTGIKTVGQLTMESIAWMKEAESLLYVVGDPIAESVLLGFNKNAVSMAKYYEESKPRIQAYNAMIARILKSVRSGKKTVAAFYGHPGVFAFPSHESIRIAKSEGFPARMLPGISSEDCLFADLGVDPAAGGCQSYEATDFLLSGPIIDPSSQLILWQIGSLGDWTFQSQQYDTSAMPLLVRKLNHFYPSSHEITLYEASMLPSVEPNIVKIKLSALGEFPVTSGMTLYVPPTRTRTADPQMISLFSQVTGKDLNSAFSKTSP